MKDRSRFQKGLTDAQIMAAMNVSCPCVECIRKRFVEGGLERALNEDPRPSQRRKLDGRGEAQLIATACSQAPEGHDHWTMRLLAGRLVELGVVERFNREGIASNQPRHGGGAKVKYGCVERERVLLELRRAPSPEKDGTNSWSLTTSQKALRKAVDGLPEISTERIWVILQEAGFRWQKSRTWCETGQVVQKRKRGVATASDADATPKKN